MENVVWVVLYVAIFVILSACGKNLDSIAPVWVVNIARLNYVFQDLIATFGWEQ